MGARKGTGRYGWNRAEDSLYAALVQMTESADVGFRDNPPSLTPWVMFTATLSPTVA